jgi:hypothetical protein
VIYTSYPDCGVKSTIEVSKDFLKAGDNILTITTSSGSFLMDMPKFIVTLKEMIPPVFYFNVPATLYDALYYGQRQLVMTVRFTDATTVKRGTLEVNGFKAYFDTQNLVYQMALDPQYLMSGPNSVKITPQSDPIDVVDLRVDVI